ncbi:MAG: hypothetical protein EA397_01575 [Deltaproteobacteria bacterium]|nr:MAG: hypothetical protein EA397_01575 [Deltaproteobacteria bacterium]
MIPLWLFTAALASPVEEILIAERDRAIQTFSKEDEQVHYLAIALHETHKLELSAVDGTLARVHEQPQRILDVDLRVGTPELDSTRPLRGLSAYEGSQKKALRLSVDGEDPDALRVALWRAIDSQYRGALQRMVMIRAEHTVKIEEEVEADDFEPREGLVDTRLPVDITFDPEAWEEILVDLSEQVDASPWVFGQGVRLTVDRSVQTFIDTEGAKLRHGRTHARLSLNLRTVAEDGDEVSVFRAFDVHDPARLPEREVLAAWADQAVQHLHALREAPRGTPYTGPVLLEGKASAVFFHEVFGHRVEGHRQKREWEGRTFAAKIGERILPPFIDVYDDPSLARWGEIDLNGHYAYDDEGVPAQRAELVREGRFAGFLMSRSPLPEVEGSNGHGRRQPGREPVARMANTIVHARQAVSPKELRAKLVAEVRRQGLEYGYIVRDIDGGFTLTGRMIPNSFNVRANTTFRVYADGRPDELVRGIDLVGTPLVAFQNVVAASTEVEVFNGHCGAESGWVPVSGVAPGLLVSRLEFQLKEKGQERPPLIDKPITADGSADGGVQ